MAEGFIQNEGCIDKLGSFSTCHDITMGHGRLGLGFSPGSVLRCVGHIFILWDGRSSHPGRLLQVVESQVKHFVESICEVFLGKPIPKVILQQSFQSSLKGFLPTRSYLEMMWSTCSFSHRLGSHTKALTRSQAWDTNLILWQNINMKIS